MTTKHLLRSSSVIASPVITREPTVRQLERRRRNLVLLGKLQRDERRSYAERRLRLPSDAELLRTVGFERLSRARDKPEPISPYSSYWLGE